MIHDNKGNSRSKIGRHLTIGISQNLRGDKVGKAKLLLKFEVNRTTADPSGEASTPFGRHVVERRSTLQEGSEPQNDRERKRGTKRVRGRPTGAVLEPDGRGGGDRAEADCEES
ncbi:hypothetical protein KSP39_PZI002687 [Platanthera zijinensis]|uniref:Uncharacterized protein n=1 Tax=Platanthera zijinensis TaxID=2320716 RepID=A0AAP0BZD1_9ASPA